MVEHWPLVALLDKKVLGLIAIRIFTDYQKLLKEIRELAVTGKPARVEAMRGLGPRTGLPAPVMVLGDSIWVNGSQLSHPGLKHILEGAWDVSIPYCADLIQNLLEVLEEAKNQIRELKPALEEDRDLKEAQGYIEDLLIAIREGQG